MEDGGEAADDAVGGEAGETKVDGDGADGGCDWVDDVEWGGEEDAVEGGDPEQAWYTGVSRPSSLQFASGGPAWHPR